MQAPIQLTSLSSPTTAINAQFHLTKRPGLVLESNAYTAKDNKLALPIINMYTSADQQQVGWYVKVIQAQAHLCQAAPELLMLDSVKPWSELPANPLGELPRVVNAIETLPVEFNYTWEATGSANVAIEMWLMRRRDGVQQGDNHEIAAEVMVWLDRRGSIQPAGKEVVTQADSPIGFGLHMSSGFPSDGGPPWPYFAFTSNKAICDDTLDMATFLKYLVHRGMITGDLWVRSCEKMTEIIDGELWFLLQKIDARLS